MSDYLATIKVDLSNSLEIAFDENRALIIQSLKVLIKNNRWETYLYNFAELKEALKFLKFYNSCKSMNLSNRPTLII